MFPNEMRVREILTHPEVYPHVSDDFSPPRAEFSPLPSFYLEPIDGVLISLVPMYQTLWTAHIAALPEARGKASEAVQWAVEWLRGNTACQQVLAIFPEGSMAAGLVGRCNFERVGVVPDSFKRGGEMLPLHIYSLRIR